MTMNRLLARLGLALALAAALAACRTAKVENTYNYDAAAHQRATELRSKALALMANSGDPYSRHRTDAEAVGTAMEKAYELSAAAPDNALVVAEWAAIKDPAGSLYGGYVKRWQAKGRIDQATRDAAINKVIAHFDYLLCLEAAKRTKGGICTSPDGVPSAPPPPADQEPSADSVLSPAPA